MSDLIDEGADALEKRGFMSVSDAKPGKELKLFFCWLNPDDWNDKAEYHYAVGAYEPDAMPWATHVLYLSPPDPPTPK